MRELRTETSVRKSSSDEFFLAGKRAEGKEKERVFSIVDHIRKLSGRSEKVRIVSTNYIGKERHSYSMGKGLGFSASGGAALALSCAREFGLDVTEKQLSTIARRLAGSAARSLVGGFSRWVAGKDDKSSYAYRIDKGDLDFVMVVYPIPSSSGIKTELAHLEVLKSMFFRERVKGMKPLVNEMEKAIRKKDVEKMCRLTEEDSFNLHAVTMTSGLFALEPESIGIYRKVLELRKKGVMAYVSWDTGPTTYVNTVSKNVHKVIDFVDSSMTPIVCTVGDGARAV